MQEIKHRAGDKMLNELQSLTSKKLALFYLISQLDC